jgi:hypothetical protein
VSACTAEYKAATRTAQILGVIVSLLCGQASWAQTDTESSWENLRALRTGQQVEVFQTDLRSQRGEFFEVSDEAVSLKVQTDTVSIPRGQVLRVSTREKSRRLRNILMGAAVGAAVGFGAGAWVDSKASESGENLGRFIGFLAGVGSGAGIGAAIPGNQTIYRATAAARPDAKDHSTDDEEVGPLREVSRTGAEDSRNQPFNQGLLSPSE